MLRLIKIWLLGWQTLKDLPHNMIFKLQFPTILLLESLAMEINCLKTSSIKGCTNPGCQINFLSWWIIFVAPQKICSFMSPSQQLQFWKTDGPNLSAKIPSCQGNYIYCVNHECWGILLWTQIFTIHTKIFFLVIIFQKPFICINCPVGMHASKIMRH